jgi:hypothetical protein
VRKLLYLLKAAGELHRPQLDRARIFLLLAVLNEVGAVVRRLAGILQADNLAGYPARLCQVFPNQRPPKWGDYANCFRPMAWREGRCPAITNALPDFLAISISR